MSKRAYFIGLQISVACSHLLTKTTTKCALCVSDETQTLLFDQPLGCHLIPSLNQFHLILVFNLSWITLQYRSPAQQGITITLCRVQATHHICKSFASPLGSTLSSYLLHFYSCDFSQAATIIHQIYF